MATKAYPEKTKQLLVNLAQRLRARRRYLTRARLENFPAEMLEHARGAHLEAHNTFQAAKAIVFQNKN